jgi:hypothetical protein
MTPGELREIQLKAEAFDLVFNGQVSPMSVFWENYKELEVLYKQDQSQFINRLMILTLEKACTVVISEKELEVL